MVDAILKAEIIFTLLLCSIAIELAAVAADFFSFRLIVFGSDLFIHILFSPFNVSRSVRVRCSHTSSIGIFYGIFFAVASAAAIKCCASFQSNPST